MVASKTAKRRSGRSVPNPKNFRPKRTAVSGVIQADEVLTIDAFCARMACKAASITEMRRRGLIVRQDGKNRLRIHGADYLEYVRSLPPAPIRGEAVTESAQPAVPAESAQ